MSDISEQVGSDERPPPETSIGFTPDPVDRFFAFIRERAAIDNRRDAGQPPPWSADRILGNWSFCELDRTRWINSNWRDPHRDDPDLWFAMTVARHVNVPETLAEIGYPVPWDADHFLSVMARKEKCAYQVQAIFDPLWRNRERLRPRAGDTLRVFHNRLEVFDGMGGFITAQVIADLKYVEPLRSARDWWTFAASGPGSRKGLNLVRGRPADRKWEEVYWCEALGNRQERMQPMFEAAGMEPPDAQELQNWLCEFTKYERARRGESMPKRRVSPNVASASLKEF